jgi:hypothetical protein
MTMTIFNHDLHRMFQELSGLNNSVLGVLLRAKINEFVKNNGVRNRSLQDKIAELTRKYVETEIKDDQEIVIYEGEGADRKPKIRDGFTLEEYQTEYKLLMEQTTLITM